MSEELEEGFACFICSTNYATEKEAQECVKKHTIKEIVEIGPAWEDFFYDEFIKEF